MLCGGGGGGHDTPINVKKYAPRFIVTHREQHSEYATWIFVSLIIVFF